MSTSGPHRLDDCTICRSLSPEGKRDAEVVFENDLWHVRHSEMPFGVPGWIMLITQRHAPGPAYFDDREAASFGFTLRHLQRVLQEVSGALRIYTAALGEGCHHFHAHLVPRTATMPKDAKGWAVFDLQRAAAAKEIKVDLDAAKALSARYRDALKADPPRGY